MLKRSQKSIHSLFISGRGMPLALKAAARPIQMCSSMNDMVSEWPQSHSIHSPVSSMAGSPSLEGKKKSQSTTSRFCLSVTVTPWYRIEVVPALDLHHREVVLSGLARDDRRAHHQPPPFHLTGIIHALQRDLHSPVGAVPLPGDFSAVFQPTTQVAAALRADQLDLAVLFQALGEERLRVSHQRTITSIGVRCDSELSRRMHLGLVHTLPSMFWLLPQNGQRQI